MSGETGDSPASDASNSDPTAAGSQSIRNTAKWLVAAFGAVGGALVTSLQLKDLGSLSGASKAQALWGFAIAIFGVLLALVTTALVLAAKTVHLEEYSEMRRGNVFTGPRKRDSYLRRFLKRNPRLLSGFDSIETLNTQYSESSTTRVNAYLAMEDARLALATQNLEGASRDEAESKRAKAQAEYVVANDRLSLVNPIVTQLLNVGIFEKIKRQWYIALAAIVVGVGLAAFGAGLFATADKTPSKSPTNPVTTAALVPRVQVLDLSPTGQAKLRSKLGEGCDLTHMGVYVLEKEKSGWNVFVVDSSCRSVEATVSSKDANVKPCVVATSQNTTTTVLPTETRHENDAGRIYVISNRGPPTTTTTTLAPFPANGGPCPSVKSG